MFYLSDGCYGEAEAALRRANEIGANFGSHTATTLLHLFWVFLRLAVARGLGRALTLANDPLGARVRPLAWGWTAALAGTMAANFFYLTMQFYYFYVFLGLILAVPIVFGAPRRATQAVRRLVPSTA